MQELFDLVRESAERSVWTRGVELARSGAVLDEGPAGSGAADADEPVLRVKTAGVVHPSVVLYPEDEAWECDCGSAEDPCEHVAAAVIAVRRARREGEPLPRAAGSGSLGYRLTTTSEGLSLERVVVSGGEETPLRGTLSALASGRVSGPEVVATQADLAVERTLGPRLRGVLPRGVLRGLLKPLSECPDVTLDGVPVRPSPEPVVSRARLFEEPGGLRLRVEPHPPIDRTLSGGFALCGSSLRDVAPSRLSGRELEDLGGRGRRFDADEIPGLLAELLPSLEARMEVVRETPSVPTTAETPPRIEVLVEEEDEALSILPTLVYGDPPLARVDAGRLTHLQGPVPLRDEAAERQLLRRLQTATGLVPGRRVALRGDAALEMVERLRSLGGALRGSALTRYFRAPPLEPRVVVEGDRLSLRFETREPLTAGAGAGSHAEAEPEALLDAWRRGETWVPLRDGGFAPLPADWLARHGERLADLLAARDARGHVARSALPALARLCDDLELERPDLGTLERLVAEGAPHTPPPLPADLRAELRGYQREGVAFLRFLGDAELGALLADDMGLGKTLQALCALEPPALVVAPTSVLGNWSQELARFRPGLRVDLHHGQSRSLDPDADVTLTSYALLRRDRDEIAAVEWESLVLDEAQAIKNPDSQVARAARAVHARRRIALTGTPIENHLEEIWSQMQVLNPGLLGSRADFEARTAGPARRGDEAALERLRERIGPFVLRRRKAEVAPELPPRTETVLSVELSEEERVVYDSIRAATLGEVVAQLESGGSVMAALEALLRLRQACCDVALVPGQASRATPSSKRALLRERLETAVEEGHKCLVFSQWTALLDRIEPDLAEAGLAYVRLDGSTRDRTGVVERFQSPDGPPVFLISLKAGGTGLNLTEADHVFLVDPWWNPAVEDQAADRAHRIGQDRPVFVHRLAARDTVEERILALQESKRALAEAALGGAGAAGTLRREELLELLRA